MDASTPTTEESDYLRQVVEEGMLSPPPTPTPLSRPNNTQFISHTHSPLHATLATTSKTSPSLRENTPQEEEEQPKEKDKHDAAPRRQRAPLQRILRRPSRHSRKKRSHSGDPSQEKKTLKHKLKNSRYSPFLVLENSGSVARDHLASERTFLAYVRTSLGLASMGVALVQLFTIADLTSLATNSPVPAASRYIQKFAKPLGGLTIAYALAVLIIGIWRYFKIQIALPLNKFPIARSSVAFTGVVFTAIIVVIFAAVLSDRSR